MRSKMKWVILFLLVLIVAGLYLYPIPRVPFNEVYAKAEESESVSLSAFRINYPPSLLEVNGVEWEYLAMGEGEETILFLHGMTGAYDIWWHQLEALQSDYRVIAVTYPAVNTLAELDAGVMSILEAEGVDKFNVVGTSLGGYFAQYLVAHHPDRILRAVFSNTFPPNDLIAEKNKTIGTALPFLPEWLVIDVLRGSFASSVYPASGNDELTLAFLNEISYGRMSKAQVVGRFHCVVEKFEAPDLNTLGIPVLIVEADNDPLVELALREQLKAVYPTAEVQIFSGVGHFPYLNRASEYTKILADFLVKPLK
ncbi:alpha/beta hydrolase [Candidatus Villigracilis saccharophilus]|uniref:alpha/beta fold hydrolase n=1 Tax=Candidatus Villigracilis saccharophilus TaxID=3140684 RepID=UPI0031347A73|nr:alpha/beta hydrolase [Anaerolineales bacterium]